MTKQIPDKPTHLFDITAPIGYKTVKVCGVGHPVVFEHAQTGQAYIPFTVNQQIVCGLCLAPVIGLTCARAHKSFEVEDA
jgi:hypothetical protein